jgi:hypothetical protein
VVSRFGALQAQDYEGGKWSIGLRLPGATETSIEDAVSDGRIVRTWLMRGTLHFVAPRDVRWMLKLLAPRLIGRSARRNAQLDLDDGVFECGRELFSEALGGGKQLTRKEMMGVLERGGISTAGQRGYHILWRLAVEGLLCFGPMRGRQPTFTLLDDWVPHRDDVARDRALAELAGRYFTSHGPAQLQDFVWWSGLTALDARAGLGAATPGLAVETVDGREYWSSPGVLDDAGRPPTAHLLQTYDEYWIGYKDRGVLFDGASKPPPAAFSPTIVIDGRVRGAWKRTVKKGAIIIEAHPYAAMSGSDIAALEDAAKRYGDYLGLPAALSVVPRRAAAQAQ